jgi:hypothetical protein
MISSQMPFATILDKANDVGYINVVVPHLTPGGVSNHQYAGDTLMLLQLDEREREALIILSLS